MSHVGKSLSLHYDCPFDLPSMTPGESHNEWYHYYCSNFYVFNSNLEFQSLICLAAQFLSLRGLHARPSAVVRAEPLFWAKKGFSRTTFLAKVGSFFQFPLDFFNTMTKT